MKIPNSLEFGKRGKKGKKGNVREKTGKSSKIHFFSNLGYNAKKANAETEGAHQILMEPSAPKSGAEHMILK